MNTNLTQLIDKLKLKYAEVLNIIQVTIKEILKTV